MIPPSGDRSDVLFKRLLALSLLVYFIFALFIEMIPYTPKIIKGPLKPQRTVKLTEISVKEPELTDEQKKRQEEKRLAEERRLMEERRRQELERQQLEDQKRSEEERRRRMKAQKRQEEEQRLAEERQRLEEQKRLEEEKRLAEEQRRTEERQRLEEQKHAAEEQQRIEEQKRQEEKKRLTEEQQRIEEQKRQEEERRVAEERQRIEEQKRLEEEKRVAEEQRRIEEQKRLDDEKRLAEERQRIEEQKRMEEEKRLVEERRRIEEQKRIEEERRLAKEKNREVAKGSGLLKTMKGGKKPADNIIEDQEISSVLSAPADKLIQSPQGKPQSAGPKERTPVQKAVPSSTKEAEKGLKGSEGIGDVSETLAIKTPSSGLSGERHVADIEIKQVDVGGGGGGSGTGGDDTSVVHPRRSQKAIKEVVATHRGSLDFIYKKALRNNPTLKGVVIIEFTIAANGDVIGGRIASSTVKDPSFEEQVLKRILTWKFPPLPDSGSTIVTYPIEFSPV